MKILLFAEKTTYESNRLKEEANNKGYVLDTIKFSDISYGFKDNSVKILVNGEEKDLIGTYDTFFLRSSKTSEGHHYIRDTGIFRYMIKQSGKFVLNYDLAIHHTNPSIKVYTYAVLASNGLPILKTFVFNTMKQLELHKEKLTFPLIAKDSIGSHGDGVHLIKNIDDLYVHLMTRSIDEVLIQEFVDTNTDERSDVRVLVIGNDIVGAFERFTSKDKLVTNYSRGGNIRPYVLSDEVIEITKEIIGIFKIDYAGIDFIFKDGKPYILEINRAAQFKGFESITGINVAEKLLDYIVLKATY